MQVEQALRALAALELRLDLGLVAALEPRAGHAELPPDDLGGDEVVDRLDVRVRPLAR